MKMSQQFRTDQSGLMLPLQVRVKIRFILNKIKIKNLFQMNEMTKIKVVWKSAASG